MKAFSLLQNMLRTVFQNNVKISKYQDIYSSSFARWIYDTKQNRHTIVNQNFNNSSNIINSKGSIKSLTSSKLLNFPISKPSIPNQDGFFKKIGKEIKWNFYVKGKRESSAIYIYEACADNIDVKEFFSYFKLPDTFTSWFLVIELHVWMCMTRAMNEEKGKYLRNKIVNAMWEDTETRMKLLEGVSPQARKETLVQLSDQFKAAVVSYDEGSLGDDMDLAAALWRVFFSYECHDPCILETLVHYVRKHIFYLDHLNVEEYYKGNIKWSSLKEFVIS